MHIHHSSFENHALHRSHTRPASGDGLHPLAIKRARDPAAAEDGVRVLIDRLWPRGLSKDKVAIDLWLREAAPSGELRRWFRHDPHRWPSFAEKYRQELARRIDVLEVLDRLRQRGRVTLVYDAADRAHNNAVVLREVLDERFWLRHPRGTAKP